MTPEQRAMVVAARLGTKRDVRATVDVDLTATSLLNAAGVLGEGPFVLKVHWSRVWWAKSAVTQAFAGYRPFIEEFLIMRHESTDTDMWSLENAETRYVSNGA